jgi:hypothetical protein
MSLAVIIGSEVEDITNIQNTIELLKFTKNIVSDSVLSMPNDNNIDSEKLDNIITWYTGIHNLLTDPNSFPTYQE